MAYSKADELFFMSYAESRAAKVIYHKYRVNRHELSYLAGVAAYLQLHGKKAVSRGLLYQWFGYGPKLKSKMAGYMRGVIDKGLVHQVNFRCQPNAKGNSMALSQYGCNVLAAYYQELDKIDQANTARKSKPGYKSIAVDTTMVAEMLPHYTLVKAGKDQ